MSLRSGDTTLPQQVIAPFARIERIAEVSTSPPRVSTHPAHCSLRRGLPLSSINSAGSITRAAPILKRNSLSSLRLFSAVTEKPEWERMETAILPTPPLAPVTNTSSLLLMPKSVKRKIDKVAVKPAVPKIMLSRSDRPAGFLTIHEDGTLINCPSPPEVFMPRS